MLMKLLAKEKLKLFVNESTIKRRSKLTIEKRIFLPPLIGSPWKLRSEEKVEKGVREKT